MVLALLATDDLGRVLRVQAKPLCGRFASLDTATPAKGGQLRGGRGRSRTRSGYERRTSAQGRRAISVGDEGSTTATRDHQSCQLSAPNRRNRSASQADSASSILVTRSHREGPGQGRIPSLGLDRSGEVVDLPC